MFSAREVVAAGESFRPWGREFHDAGVALDELTSLEPREPTVLRVARGAGRPRSGPWARVVGDWLLEPGEAPRRLPRPSWEYDAEARGWSTAREWPEAWEPCEDARWMLHAAASVGVDRCLVVLAACACARTSLRYVPEGEARPLRAIETAEAWARGEATAEQARTAAYAAYDAAEAAAYAAEAADVAFRLYHKLKPRLVADQVVRGAHPDRGERQLARRRARARPARADRVWSAE